MQRLLWSFLFLDIFAVVSECLTSDDNKHNKRQTAEDKA